MSDEPGAMIKLYALVVLTAGAVRLVSAILN